MWCPYCGYEMRQGFVRLRGQWAAWAGVLAVNFEAGDDSGEGSELLPRTLFRSHERAAHCCVRCEAVLVEPKSGTYVPPTGAAPTDTAAEGAIPGAPEPSTAEPGGVDAADIGTGGDGATEPRAAGVAGSAGGAPGEAGVADSGSGNGNGHGPSS